MADDGVSWEGLDRPVGSELAGNPGRVLRTFDVGLQVSHDVSAALYVCSQQYGTLILPSQDGCLLAEKIEGRQCRSRVCCCILRLMGSCPRGQIIHAPHAVAAACGWSSTKEACVASVVLTTDTAVSRGLAVKTPPGLDGRPAPIEGNDDG